MPTYSAADIVGKTLIAKKAVPCKRSAQSNSATIYTAKRGETVGVVYSWVSDNGGGVWWAFYDANNRPYYAKHAPGLFDIQSLSAQEVESLEKQLEAEKKADDPVGYYLNKFVKPITWAVVGYFGVRAGLDIYDKTRRRRRA